MSPMFSHSLFIKLFCSSLYNQSVKLQLALWRGTEYTVASLILYNSNTGITYGCCRRCNYLILRCLLEIIFYFLANLVNIIQWRGVWLTCNVHLLPDQLATSSAITLTVGVLGLMLLLAGNSLTVRGCELDGDSPPETGCYCPNRYIRYFLDRRNQSKIASLEDPVNPELGDGNSSSRSSSVWTVDVAEVLKPPQPALFELYDSEPPTNG